MTVVTVSEKGWIVIPKEIRKRHGIKKGDKISVVDYGGRIYLFRAPQDPIREALGMLKDDGPPLTQTLLEERRREKARENEKLRRWGVDPLKLD